MGEGREAGEKGGRGEKEIDGEKQGDREGEKEGEKREGPSPKITFPPI